MDKTYSTFYEVVVLDYGKDHNKVKLKTTESLEDAKKIAAKFKKRYMNVRIQEVLTRWIE